MEVLPALRRRAFAKDIVDDIDYISDIYYSIAVDIA
jgi:hypothetical protein